MKSRKELFLEYKRELCKMDGCDDLIDPLWMYDYDYQIFTQHEDAHWFPVYDNGKEIGFLIILEGELATNINADQYIIQDVYLEPEYRGKGIMEKKVENFINLHPGKYEMVIMDNNPHAKKFWDKIVEKHGGYTSIGKGVIKGCKKYKFEEKQ